MFGNAVLLVLADKLKPPPRDQRCSQGFVRPDGRCGAGQGERAAETRQSARESDAVFMRVEERARTMA
eukprot:757508-Hanusia_phi.AAC.7